MDTRWWASSGRLQLPVWCMTMYRSRDITSPLAASSYSVAHSCASCGLILPSTYQIGTRPLNVEDSEERDGNGVGNDGRCVFLFIPWALIPFRRRFRRCFLSWIHTDHRDEISLSPLTIPPVLLSHIHSLTHPQLDTRLHPLPRLLGRDARSHDLPPPSHFRPQTPFHSRLLWQYRTHLIFHLGTEKHTFDFAGVYLPARMPLMVLNLIFPDGLCWAKNGDYVWDEEGGCLDDGVGCHGSRMGEIWEVCEEGAHESL